MKYKRSFTDQLPALSFLDRSTPAPFISYHNSTETAVRPLEIPASLRFRHVYIAGSTRHGKSTLMEHMIAQDMQNGEGLTLLDPKGDLADLAVNRVPRHRINDCIFLDVQNPVPINLMSWSDENERQTLMADINQTFMRFSTMAAGDQWGSILRWTIYTLLSARKVCFLDLYYFFSDQNRHDAIIDLVRKNNVDGMYDDILHYWKNEFPKLKSPREGPILTRMSTFTTSPPLKKLLGSPDAELDIFKCMEERKILIVKLIGAGKANGNDVGALITSKIQQSAFRRHSQPTGSRVPHFFYADEFQNFQTSDFDGILSEAGGFKLSLTLANQGLYQLDTKIKQSIFANVTAARIAFHLSHEDVSNWRHILPANPNKEPDRITIEPDQLANLPPYSAFFKIGNEEGLIVRTPEPLPPPSREQIAIAEEIKSNTLSRYGPKAAPSAQNSQNRTGDKNPSQHIENMSESEEDEGPTFLSDKT